MNASQIRLNYPYFARKSKNMLNYVKRIVNLRPKLNLFIWYSGGPVWLSTHVVVTPKFLYKFNNVI